MNRDKIKTLFAGRKLIIATKHNKEEVLAPVLSIVLNVECINDPTLDTDRLGTFTGEIERIDDVLVTARNKCQMAMEASNCDMAVASEGSFGPHPTLGFINADDEILMFLDVKNDLEIVVRELSINTNFNGQEIKTKKELLDFANHVKFPSHALIIRKAYADNSEIIKGITDSLILQNAFQTFINKYGSAYVETDMRAMYNPTRMEVIKTAAEKLVKKITCFCPDCETPGFGVKEARAGLPCVLCGFPTKSILSHLYHCLKCNYSEEKKYPYGKQNEEPAFCDNCNP